MSGCIIDRGIIAMACQEWARWQWAEKKIRELAEGFTIEGELDDISGEGQTRAAQDLCSGIPAKRKQHYTAPECGHYGIFAGRRWRTTICPQIAEFVRKY